MDIIETKIFGEAMRLELQELKRRCKKTLKHALHGELSKEYFESVIDENAPWIFVSYVTDICYDRENKWLQSFHQNRKETLTIIDVLNKQGYNVIIQEYDSLLPLPNKNVVAVFGIEPLFERACQKYKKAKKIYYATCAYWEHQNSQVNIMTEMVNREMYSKIKRRRMVLSHSSAELADTILQIGSKFTIETYPQQFRKKIHIIRQSTQAPLFWEKKEFSEKNEFFCMVGEGNALKGLFPIIKYFNKHQNININIVGAIEDDFKAAVSPLLSSNIKLWGFVSVYDEKMKRILQNCNYVISLSGSEGGAPGGVLNAMKNGLIPITTKWSSVSNIEDLGILLDDSSEVALSKAINRIQNLSIESIKELSQINIIYVNSNYSLENFTNEINAFFLNEL